MKLHPLLLTLLCVATTFTARGATNALDRIDFGDIVSEGVHQFMPATAPADVAPRGVGAYGLPYREPVGSGSNSPAGSQVLTFTMGCDPARQNYISVKLWGNDTPAQMYLLDSGTGSLAIEESGGAIVFPNRFHYYTFPIPISKTTGKTSVPVTLFFAAYYDAYGGTGTNYLAQGQTTRPIYSAFTHSEPMFVPEQSEVVGSAPARSGQATLDTLTMAEAVALLRVKREATFNAGGYLDDMIARQVPAGTAGAPAEVIGLDLFSTVSTWTAANPAATNDQWRNKIANTKAGPGYTAFPDELLGVLTTAYLLPPFTDENNAVVAGLDRYHDATLLAKIVAAIDGASHETDLDGGFIQQGSEWTGHTSTARTTGAYIGSTAAQNTYHGGGDLQGVDTYALGWTVINLLNDPVGGPALQTYLAGSYDADLTGGSMLRADAWERMLFKSINFYAYGTGGTVSQNLFQMVALYANHVALQKLQALYPNAAYIPGPTTYNSGNWLGSATPLDAARMVMGIIPTTLRGPKYPTSGTQTNLSLTAKGFGEAEGAMSCGFDGGGYGQILPWLAPRIAQIAAWDPTASAADRTALNERAHATIDGFAQFLGPLDNSTVTNGVLVSNTYGFNSEPWITYRDNKNPNTGSGSLNFNAQLPASDPNGALNNAYARRAAYLYTQYGTSPGTGAGGGLSLNYNRDLSAYESTIRALVGVNPATLTPLPAEPGQPDFAWADVQCGAVAVINNGERLYMNLNWRNSLGSVSNIARVHYTTAGIERAAQIIMPFDAADVQSDGNLTSTTYIGTYIVRYGDYLVVLNNSAASKNATLPQGFGQAKNLIAGTFHNLGATVAVPAGQAAIFWLAASPTQPGGAGAPTIATAANVTSSTATTANLSVLGADDGGEAALTYTWSASGPSPVTYATNGTNAAKNTTATFSADGSYTFTVVARDAGGLAVSSTLNVNVAQALTSITVSPTPITLASSATQQFVAQPLDQFGAPMSSPVAITWSIASGIGSVDTFGLYTAPAAGGSASVRASAGALNATASVTVLAPLGVLAGAQDIGSPTLAGSSSFGSGTYTMSASGIDIWNASDQFRFAYLPITGDVTVTARVASLVNTNANAKAGVMIRNSLAADSAEVSTLVTPSTGIHFQRRTSAAANTVETNAAGFVAPYWVRLVRNGANFSAYRSPDGSAWTQIGTTQTVTMNETIFVGLAVTSHTNSALTTATFTDVSITQPTYIFPETDNINTDTPGTYSDDGTTATVSGIGGDVWSTADGIVLSHKAMTGDATITARVVSISATPANAKVGVMIRDTLDAGSREASTLITPNNNVRFSRRTATDGSTSETIVSTFTAPYYVRVVRTGSSFSGWRSPDGAAWTQVGTTQTITMGASVHVGLVVAALDGSTASTAVFDNITVTGALNVAPTIATQPSANVTDNYATLSVLGADSDGGESNLTYTWDVLGVPMGGVNFSANGTNAAKNITASFGTAGTYYLQVRVADSGGSVVTSDILPVTVGAPTTPNVPTGLAATPGAVGSGQVTLNWNASNGLPTYNVKRATTSGGPYTTIATGLTALTFVDTGLNLGTPYYYVVSAVNFTLESANSTQLAYTPDFPAPSNLIALPGNTVASMSWTASPSATSYKVQRATVSGGPYSLVGTPTGTSYIDFGLTNGATYYYVVSAVNPGAESPASSQAGVTPAITLPAVHLRFDETSGTTAADSSGNGWNGTLAGAATFTAGNINNAVSLPGASADRVTLPTGVVSAYNDFTIAAWVKPNSIGTFSRVFDFGTGTTNYMFLTPRAGSSGPVRFAIRTAAVSEQIINGTAALTAGVWTHVAVTLSGTTGTLYVNGVAVGTNTAMTLRPSSLGSTTQNYLGDSQFTADPSLNGLVDEFQIYNRALAAGEIATFATPPTAPTGLAATGGNTQVALTWNAVSGATGYHIKRATVSGGPYTTVGTATTTTFTNTGLTNGTTYYYVVTTANLVAESANSTQASAIPVPPIAAWELVAPPVVVDAGGNVSITIAVTVTGRTYQLQRRTDLTTGAWVNIGSPQTGDGAAVILSDTASGLAKCFYRVLLQ